MCAPIVQESLVRGTLARHCERRAELAGVLLSLTLFGACGHREAQVLELGASIERDTTAGAVHVYRLDIGVEHFVRLQVHHPSIGLHLQVFGPEGRELSPKAAFPYHSDQQVLSWLSQAAGSHRVEVHGVGEPGSQGRYTIDIDALRQATSQDVHRVVAERRFAEGYRLRLESSATARQAAIGLYEQALEAWRNSGDLGGQAKALNATGFAYRLLESYDTAVEHYLAAIDLWCQAGQIEGEIDSLNNLAFAYSRLGRYDDAQTTYETALVKAEGDHARQASILNNRALAYREVYDYDKAQEGYQQAVDLRRAEGDTVGMAKSLANLAVVYTHLQEQRQALDLFHEAIPLLRAAGEAHPLAAALNNLGRSYAVLGQYERAMTYYFEALEISRSLADGRSVGRTLNNLGLAYHFTDQPELALESFRAALRLARDARFEATVLLNAGRSHRTLGQMDQAQDYCEQALAIRRQQSDLRGEAISLTELASIRIEGGRLDEALPLLERSVALSQSVTSQRNAAVALLEWSRAAHRQGDLAVALDKIEQAIRIVEARRSKVASTSQRAVFLAAKRRFYDHRIAVLMALHERQPNAGYDRRALIASEQARARSLVDLLDEAQIGVDRRAGADLQRRALALTRRVNRLALERSRLARREPDGSEIEVVEEHLIKALAELDRLDVQVRGASPAYAALTAPQPPTLEEIRREVLDHDTLLLEVALGEERSFLWVVSQSGLDSHRLPPRADIEVAARAFYDLLTARERQPPDETPEQRLDRVRRADGELPAAARALSAMLRLPEVGSLQARRWLVVTEGGLNYVPFAALADLGAPPRNLGSGETNWPPLIERHEIVRLPSASALLALRRESPRQSDDLEPLLVLADPVFDAYDSRVSEPPLEAPRSESPSGRSVRGYLEELPLRRLRFTGQEAEAIAGAVPNSAAEVWLGLEATKAAVIGGALERYRIVHFATHGLLADHHPELSALVLSLFDARGRAIDGFLRLHDVYDLELAAELVVLSACQTALGKEIRGEGLVGLTRGFMYAGAPRVLATLWTVQDRASKDLMQRVYQRMLRDGERPAAALRQAQLDLWQGGRFSQPYYWAGFELQGEWR